TAVLTPITLEQAKADDIFSVTLEQQPLINEFPLGSTEISWMARDTSGNQNSKVQTVTVVDTTAPILNIPADIVKEATAVRTSLDIGSASTTDIFPTVLSNDLLDSNFPLGKSIITWSSKDSSGNVTNKLQSITITDKTPPSLTVPTNLVIEAQQALSKIEFGQASANDIFGVLSLTNNAPTLFPVGTTSITWTAVDNNGNSSSQVQVVTIVDTTAPDFIVEVLKQDSIWPANYKMVHVATVEDISDRVDQAPTISIDITSNANDKHQKHTHKRFEHVDWKVKQVGSEWQIWLRAEHNRHSREPRIYDVTITATDAYANSHAETHQFTVAHKHKHRKGKHKNAKQKKKHKKEHKHRHNDRD
ncbi:MAG: HYR domain-containing protein, partial [Gammaproteobacteria bacterium]|nr:HYR domain-containing protein [Gammaproteobacteria bacterium]